MAKNASRGIITLVILLAIFSVIAFVIPFPKSTVFWIAYLCGIFAILFQVYIFRSSFGKADAKSRFYGFPIVRLGIYYLAIQLIVSIIEIALSKVLPVWVIIIINALILAIALIGCITTETMRDEIAAQDMKLKKSIFNMRELQSLTATLPDQTDDAELKESLQKVADEFRYSDPLSSDKTRILEEDMHSQIGNLQQALVDGDVDGAKELCSKLLDCLKERNRVCSLSK